jgi:hypothetical protein
VCCSPVPIETTSVRTSVPGGVRTLTRASSPSYRYIPSNKHGMGGESKHRSKPTASTNKQACNRRSTLSYLTESVVAPASHASINHENANMVSSCTDGGYSGQDISGGRFAPADGRTVAELQAQAQTKAPTNSRREKELRMDNGL